MDVNNFDFHDTISIWNYPFHVENLKVSYKWFMFSEICSVMRPSKNLVRTVRRRFPTQFKRHILYGTVCTSVVVHYLCSTTTMLIQFLCDYHKGIRQLNEEYQTPNE